MDTFFTILAFIIIVTIWSRASKYSNQYNYRNEDYEQWRWSRATSNANKKRLTKQQKEYNRRLALQKAKPFLKPYRDIMGELCLANENCKVNLIIESDGSKKIICINKMVTNENKRKILTAKISHTFEDTYAYTSDYMIDNIWDILCNNFTYTTAYENVYSAVTAGLLQVDESLIAATNQGTKPQQTYDSVSNTSIRTNNLLNINNATEAELLALPGVNIILAKKAIKYIQKSGGFKSVDEFIEKMKIKSVFTDKIKSLACVNIQNTNIKTNNKSSEINTQKASEDSLDIMNDDDIQNYTPHSQNERVIDL